MPKKQSATHCLSELKTKERLLSSIHFGHGRMERCYFAAYENSVYDAELVCKRGERRGKSFVYTCYLQVTRYGSDGQSLVQTGAQRLGEKKGNRFLGDSFRFMSVEKALKTGEIFLGK